MPDQGSVARERDSVAWKRGAPDRDEPRLPRRWRTLMVPCVLVLASPGVFLAPQDLPGTTGRLVAAVLAVTQAGAVWWMAQRPRTVMAVVLATGAGLELLNPTDGPGGALVVLCAFAWLLPARVSLWGLAAAVALFSTAAAVTGHPAAAVLWFVTPLLAYSWGAWGRASTARRRAEARRAVLEERARIARELHDVLAHTVSVMVVQAAAADDVFEVNPTRARQAVRDLESYGRQALGELRHFLRTVRPVDGDEPAGEPQPGLADLERLVGSLPGGAGLAVVLRREGVEAARIAPGIQLSAYRIVQESLTNTLRHARAQRVEVSLRVTGGHLLLDIRDDGQSGGRGGGRLAEGGGGRGRGIIGMRERATALGGSLDAGPDPAGGFRVHASIPLRDAQEESA